MSLEHLSASQPGLFAEPANGSAPPAPRVKSARSANRAAWWEQDLSRTATYLMGQARSDDERAFVERLYDEAMAEGPDFINYRGKSAFLAAPRLGIDPFNARLQGWARRTKDRSFGEGGPLATKPVSKTDVRAYRVNDAAKAYGLFTGHPAQVDGRGPTRIGASRSSANPSQLGLMLLCGLADMSPFGGRRPTVIEYPRDSMEGRQSKAAIPPTHTLRPRQISVSSAERRFRGPALDPRAVR